MDETADGAIEADGAVTIEGLATIVTNLAKTVEQMATRPAVQVPTELPIAKSAKEILAGMKKGESRSGGDYTGPPGRKRLFRDDDIVELIDEEKLTLLRTGLAKLHIDIGDGPVYGVVQSVMYHRRESGEAKYKVDFGRNIKEDGCMESQLRALAGA